MKRKLWPALALLLVAGLAALAWYALRGRPIAVDVARVTRGPAVDLVYATGFVEPVHPVSVAARVTAPVRAVLVREGDRVANGQALLLLDDAEQRGVLTQMQAQARGATLAEQRATALYRQGWTTRAAWDAAVAQGQAARAAQVAQAARVDQMVVRAGMTGVVLKRDVEPGDVVTPGKQLMQLGDPGEARVTATVDERDIPRVHAGQAALMSSDALPGRVIRSQVIEVTPGGDPNQRAFRVRIGLTRAEALPFGLTLEVNIITRQRTGALLVPTASLVAGQVWAIAEGKAVRRAVRIGIQGADRTEILSGLSAGEAVVVNPPADLAEGDRVRLKNPAP